MKIYDRYKIDSSEERQRYAERVGKSRNGLRQDYNQGKKLTVGCFIFWLSLAVIMWLFEDSFPDSVYSGLCVLLGISVVFSLAVIFRMMNKGDDNEYDLYIYGVHDGCFLMLNQLYESLKTIEPGEVKEIRILSAMRPTTRQKYISFRRNGIDETDYEYFAEMLEDGEMQPYPMIVLSTEEKEIDWSYIDDPVFHRQLNSLLTFVPMGDKEEHFVYLLKNSSCPVVVAPKVYKRYREHLDALFARSGMDMSRLELIKEDPEQAKMIKIIG